MISLVNFDGCMHHSAVYTNSEGDSSFSSRLPCHMLVESAVKFLGSPTAGKQGWSRWPHRGSVQKSVDGGTATSHQWCSTGWDSATSVWWRSNHSMRIPRVPSLPPSLRLPRLLDDYRVYVYRELQMKFISLSFINRKCPVFDLPNMFLLDEDSTLIERCLQKSDTLC